MKKLIRISVITLACLAVVSLSACQNVKRELGVGRNSPDEFLVVKRAPLTLPPDYALRAPDESGLPPASESTQQARAALLGGSEAQAAARTGSGEEALLAKMGTGAADPEIRSTINRENGYLVLENRTLADKLLFWKEPAPESESLPQSEVNARSEYERLRKNQEEGKPVNEGDVPVIQKKKGTIDKLF